MVGGRRSVWAGVALAAALVLAGLAAWGDIIPETPDFRDTVTDVDEHGRLQFRAHGSWRVWGVLPDVAELRRLVVGRELVCFDAGETLLRGFGLSGNGVRAANCTYLPPDPTRAWGLADRLLDDGHAVEICAETWGLLDTCPKDVP